MIAQNREFEVIKKYKMCKKYVCKYQGRGAEPKWEKGHGGRLEIQGM